MNPSTACARVLVDELIRRGVREAVLSPGSRSAPLALALDAADRAGRLRLHVRIDERSAGFLALGLAKASGVAVPVVTTSGTATANLHPAVLEASYSDIPLLVLTADRPPELRGVGANQTIDQIELYGRAVRRFVELGVPEERPGQVVVWRTTIAAALAAAGDGPVQLNLPFREPLVPDGDESWIEPLGAPAAGLDAAPAPAAPSPLSHEAAFHQPVRPKAPLCEVEAALTGRGVVVLGDGAQGLAAEAVALATARGWPVIAEPTVALPGLSAAVRGAALLLADAAFLGSHVPDLVLVAGRPTLSRGVLALLRAAGDHWVVDPHGRRHDPTRTATRFLPWLPTTAVAQPAAAGWLAAWLVAADRATAAATAVLAGEGLSEPLVARTLVAALPAGALLFVGSSRPIRDVDAFAAPRTDVRILANRGVAGIDGTVSSAIGAALAHAGPAYALLGDLTFLHDANGLVLGPAEPRPDLCIVVVNNDGGGIFRLLEPGDAAHAQSFERVFGTPHGVDLAALCAATRTPHRLASTPGELTQALVPARGIRVVEVRTDRTAGRAIHDRIRAAIASAPGPHPR